MADPVRPLLKHLDSDCMQPLTGNVADSLIQALVQEDPVAFAALLSEAEPQDVNKFHEFPYNKTCLELACEKGFGRFVSLLLQYGADPDQMNITSKLCPIHVAARNLDADVLERLLEAKANVNAIGGELGYSALHILLSKWNLQDGDQEKFDKFFDVLISAPDLNVNIKDNEGCTPLELAVEKNLTKIVDRLIVNLGAAIDEKVRTAMEKTMPELLEKYRSHINDDTSCNNNLNTWDKDTFERELFIAVNNQEINRIRAMLTALQSGGLGFSVNLDSSPSTRTLLQQACRDEMEEVAHLLLDAGCDPTKTSLIDPTPPLIIAAHVGNRTILNTLTSHLKINLNSTDADKQTALHKIAQKLPTNKQKYLDCLNIVLEKSGTKQQQLLDINAQDLAGNTALHYAAHSGEEEAVLQLLRSGSNFGVKNVLGRPAVERILPSTLEQFLDECIQVNDSGMASRDFNITFKYSLLAPPLPVRSIPPSTTYQVEEHTGDPANTEGESLQLNQNKTVEDIYPESEALWHLSQSSRHQYLLRHPVVTSFLMLKWHKVRNYFYTNLVVYTSAVIVLTTYILLLHTGSKAEDFSCKAALNVFWLLLAIFVGVLSVRELFQLGVAPLRYLFTWENYVEIVMLGCASGVLYHSEDPGSCQHLSAIAVLLAWLEFLLLVGRHPRLSTFIAMFTTVSQTFLRLLMWYSVLIIGFALSFFLLFHQHPVSGATVVEVDKNDTANKEDIFADVPAALLKVIVMMTGELEFSDLPFDNTHPVISRAIFVSFVFLITIVLLNLLNGMAVSDTQAIQSKAETIGYASRVDLISYMESMLLGDPFHFLANWPPFSWLRQWPSFNLVSKLMRGKLLRKIFKAEGTVLFYNCLPNKSFTIFPNTGRTSTRIDEQGLNKTCKCHENFTLDGNIIQSACIRIRERDQPNELTELREQIQQLQLAISTLNNQQEKLIQKLQHSH